MSAQKNICALYGLTTLLACCLCCSCSKDYELQRQHADPAGDSNHGGTTIIYDTAWIKIEGEIDLGEGEAAAELDLCKTSGGEDVRDKKIHRVEE